MATGLEIIVGTYEEFLLGYRVRPSRSATRKYDLFQSFSKHSHTSSIRSCAANGKLVASGGSDDRICVYDLEKREFIDDLYIHDGTINSLAFVPSQSHLISGGADGKIVFTKTKDWKIERVLKTAHDGSSVNCIAIHPDGKLAFSIGGDMKLKTWNLITGRQEFVVSLKNKSLGKIVDSVVWSTSGDFFAITGNDTVQVWSTATGSVVATKKCEAKPSSLAWISDNDLLVGMEDGKLMFFNLEDENEETICDIYETRIKAMKYINGYLATASTSGELNLWKIITGDKVEMDMICGVNVGCRLICLDMIELAAAGIEQEIKDEDEDDTKKTQVRQLVTSGTVTIEVDENESSEEEVVQQMKTPQSSKKRKSIKAVPTPKSNGKKQKRQSVRLTNGFVEEDC